MGQSASMSAAPSLECGDILIVNLESASNPLLLFVVVEDGASSSEEGDEQEEPVLALALTTGVKAEEVPPNKVAAGFTDIADTSI